LLYTSWEVESSGIEFFLAVEGEEVNFDTDSFLTVSKSKHLAQLKKHVNFCMCDSGVPVISCFDNYIVRVTAAASLLHVQGLWTVSLVPTAIIHLLASSLAQDRYSETLAHHMKAITGQFPFGWLVSSRGRTKRTV
jgi:hypothetical protein